jgi:hypothetical protein
MNAVPDRIALPHVGVVLRRYHDSDIDGFYAAIDENRVHLRPHMPWADEGRHEFVAFVTDAIAQWDRGADRNYVIVDDADGRYLGACGLHDRVGADGRDRLLARRRSHRPWHRERGSAHPDRRGPGDGRCLARRDPLRRGQRPQRRGRPPPRLPPRPHRGRPHLGTRRPRPVDDLDVATDWPSGTSSRGARVNGRKLNATSLIDLPELRTSSTAPR